MSRETIRTVDGRYIGEYIQDAQRLDLKRKKSKHLYRGAGPKGGWAIDAAALELLMRRGLIALRIYEEEEGDVYELSADYFRGNAQTVEHKWEGRQYVLDLGRWSRETGPKQEALGL